MSCADKRKEHEKVNADLAVKYNAISEEDQLDGYIYELQNEIIAKNKSLCLIGRIKEIAKKDSIYQIYVKLRKSDDNVYYLAQLNVSGDLSSNLINATHENESASGSFVFHPTDIVAGSGSSTKNDPDGETYSYDVSSVIFKGYLIDFKLFSKK